MSGQQRHRNQTSYDVQNTLQVVTHAMATQVRMSIEEGKQAAALGS